MVLILKDSSRLEMRSIPNFRKTEIYILERINLKAKIQTNNEKGFAA